MEFFSLSKVELYSPGNKAFLLRSVQLLQEELTQFDINLQREASERNIKGIRQVIHKIKPSVELFLFPKEYFDLLIGVYGISEENFADHTSFDLTIEKINIFTKNILQELNTYLNLNQLNVLLLTTFF